MPSIRLVLPSPFGPDRHDQSLRAWDRRARQPMVAEVAELDPAQVHASRHARDEPCAALLSADRARGAAPASRGR